MAEAEEKSGFPWAVRTGDLKGVQNSVEKEGADVNMVWFFFVFDKVWLVWRKTDEKIKRGFACGEKNILVLHL